MDPFTALAIGSTFLSFSAQRSASRAAKREAAIRAKNIKIQKEQAKLSALQDHNARMANLQSVLNANIAIAGISGRDTGSDRSFKAIQERARKEISDDSNRAYYQYLMGQSGMEQQKQMVLEKGRNMARAYNYQAFGTLFSGAMKAKPLIGGSPMRGTGLGTVGYST